MVTLQVNIAVGLKLLSNSAFGLFRVLRVSGSANLGTSIEKAVLLQLNRKVPKSTRLKKKTYLFRFEKIAQLTITKLPGSTFLTANSKPRYSPPSFFLTLPDLVTP